MRSELNAALVRGSGEEWRRLRGRGSRPSAKTEESGKRGEEGEAGHGPPRVAEPEWPICRVLQDPNSGLHYSKTLTSRYSVSRCTGVLPIALIR